MIDEHSQYRRESSPFADMERRAQLGACRVGELRSNKEKQHAYRIKRVYPKYATKTPHWVEGGCAWTQKLHSMLRDYRLEKAVLRLKEKKWGRRCQTNIAGERLRGEALGQENAAPMR